MGHCLVGFHSVNMRFFVALLSVGATLAAPAADPQVVVAAAKPYINQGAASGPVHQAVGDLVATPNGFRSLSLEGFSEDLNQDGFVDPIGQVAPVVQYAAPVVQAAAPVVTAPKVEVKSVEVKAPAVATYTVPAATQVVHHAAPVATYAAAPVAVAHTPVVHQVGYQVHHTVQHVPQVHVQKHVTHHTTQHVINHAPVVGAFTGLVPAVAPVAAVQAVEAAPAEDAAPAVEMA